MTKLGKVHNIDARELDNILNEGSVDVAITSPPYFDLKDYGCKAQIGYGQSYHNYLSDLELVFGKVYKATKSTGSLWVIIDTFRKDNVVVPLPFDFSNRLKRVGWHLQDIIIWHKDKTLPWAKKGQTRSIVEYVLFFSKGQKFKYYSDRERQFDPEQLKKWWIKYPERYNPRGKALEEIWKYPIPTQGSWGNGHIRHFCPLPAELIARIIRLSTKKGDIVLDPFAGSGSVLAQAAYMKRKYVGFELNKAYIGMFNKYLKATLKNKRQQYMRAELLNSTQNVFARLIHDLRILKYARVIYKFLKSDHRRNIQAILVEKKKNRKEKNIIASAKYTIFLKKPPIMTNKLLADVKKIIRKPPLSKFGIMPDFMFLSTERLVRFMGDRRINFYSHTTTHKQVKTKGDKRDKGFFIISPIKVELDEKKYS